MSATAESVPAASTPRGIEEGRKLAAGKGTLSLSADVVIVGSGASGAVLAAHLVEAGRRVILLEEGPYIPSAEYGRMRPSQTMRKAWREGGMSFAIGVGDTPLINLHMGRCVGGSSVMTGGVCFRTPDHVLHEWVTELGLTDLSPERMAPYFEIVERDSHVETVPEAMRAPGTVRFGEGAKKLGYTLSPNQRNTDGCNGRSRCNFGCPHGAKLSVDLTYLPRALAQGAELYSDCLVEEILLEGDRAVGVRGRLLDAEDRPRRRIEVRAPQVILAAGGVHTPRLLMDSGFHERLDTIGCGMTVHPSFRVMARFDDPVYGWRGALQSAHSHAFSEDRITLMSVFVPAGVLAATMPGVGPDHTRRAELTPHLAVFGGMVHDEPGGRIHPRRSVLGWLGMLGGREPLMTYEMSRRDRKSVSRLLQVLADTFLAAGAREIFLPILGPRGHGDGKFGGYTADGLRTLDLDGVPGKQLECASQHPLGTCRMAVSRDHGVVDDHGRMFGLRGLYIVDASVLPSSLGVNPQISVMAMATRLAFKIRERKEVVL